MFLKLQEVFVGHTSYEEKLLEVILRSKHLILWKNCSGEVKG
jgi:hypothetical protein